jgi:putative DNA primase/helicase
MTAAGIKGIWPGSSDSDPLDAVTTLAELEAVVRGEATTEPAIVENSDDALALVFTQRHGGSLRYTAKLGLWFVWSDNVWRPDNTLAIFDRVRKICRDESVPCPDKRIALRISSAQTVAAVERLARADRRHAATIDQWDSNLWLLNTPSGVVDLQTGNLRPAARGDYMTKITAASPGGSCQKWQAFLARITGGDVGLQRFLQRMCGYALTGSIREHALFFLYGTGANGKSVFLNTLSGILGDYAKTAPIEAFIASKNEHHPTDIAGLQGARLVTSVETEDGRRWAEAKIKALTGGDRVSARFMRQDFFEYVPQFKLLIAGNHRPGLRTVDEAIKRRFHLVPFTVTIPVPERDLELGEKLHAEWGGILQWAIEGCLAWQREGLCAPKAVVDATENYLAAEDVFGQWVEERCATEVNTFGLSSSLFEDWKNWAESRGEFTGKQKKFSETLQSRGFRPGRTNSIRGFHGIRLKRGSVTDVTDSPIIPVTRAHTRIRSKPDDPSHASLEAGETTPKETQVTWL